MNKKSVISMALLVSAISSTAFANECNFKSLSGQLFEVGSVSHEKKFSNKMNGKKSGSYDYMHEINGGEPITTEDASGRHVKIDTSRFAHTYTESDEITKGEKHAVRVYSATLDNCKPVNFIIPETGKFAKWFNQDNDSMNGKFPFELEQSELQLIDLGDLNKVEEHVGKPIYLLHYDKLTTNGTKFGMAPVLKTINNHEKVTLDSIDYSLESGYELLASQYSLVFKTKSGERVNVPFNVNQVMFSDPTLSPNVQSKHKQAIRNGEIHYNMNMVEVFLALGEPDLVSYTASSNKIVKNDFNPYARFNPKMKYTLADTGRGYIVWDYENMELIFNEKGVLQERLQNNFKIGGYHFGERNAKKAIN